MSKDYCGGCQERHYNDDMDNLYLCDACTTVLYQGKEEIERLSAENSRLGNVIAEIKSVLGVRDR